MIAAGPELYSNLMRVEFFKGVRKKRNASGPKDLVVYWAVTPVKVFACSGPSYEPLADFDAEDAIDAELIIALDLSGVDDDSLTIVVETILYGGYLDKPGVKDKGEAVLYVVVNEALHALTQESND